MLEIRVCVAPQTHSLKVEGRALVLGPHDPSSLSRIVGRTKSSAILSRV